MAGVKVYQGGVFVDGQPRIWNGSSFVAPSAIHVWNGSAFVKVWPSFVRQRINKSGSWAISTGGLAQVTGWASDGTYPAAIHADALVVAGSAHVTVTVSVQRTFNFVSSTVELRRNGTAIQSGSFSGESGTLTWTGDIADGDQLTVWASRSSGTSVSVLAGTYIDVNPS